MRVVYANDSAVVYTLNWPAWDPSHPLDLSTTVAAPKGYTWTRAGLIVFWMVLALLGARELIRLWRPSAGVIRVLWLASMPLAGAAGG